MVVPVVSSNRHRFSLPEDPARRLATWSLLMVAATALMLVIAGALGTFLGLVVFDLEEQEILSEAGAWGYIAGFSLLALMVLPGLAGIGLGVQARRLGERRLGLTGIVVNGSIAGYLTVTTISTLVFG